MRFVLFTFLGADVLLDDFLVAENSPLQSDMNSPVNTPEKTSPRSIQSTSPSHTPAAAMDGEPEALSSGSLRFPSVAYHSFHLL